MSKHMKLPWKAECVGVTNAGPDGAEVYEIISADERARIAEYLSGPDAAFIVASVNALPGLLLALDALRKCRSAMQMQEMREKEHFHIKSDAAMAIWREATKAADEAIAAADGAAT